jgi:hypothetical protein
MELDARLANFLFMASVGADRYLLALACGFDMRLARLLSDLQSKASIYQPISLWARRRGVIMQAISTFG